MDADLAGEAFVAAAIHRRLDSPDWAAELHARGWAVVGVDDQGQIRRYFRDGTSTVIPAT